LGNIAHIDDIYTQIGKHTLCVISKSQAVMYTEKWLYFSAKQTLLLWTIYSKRHTTLNIVPFLMNFKITRLWLAFSEGIFSTDVQPLTTSTDIA